MVPFRVLSRTNLAGCPPSISCTSSISFASFRLRTLDFSLRSFSHLDPLFSITSALFSQNTGGCGYQHFRVTLCLRRRMRHVALVSPVPSLDCVYFPSPRGCTTNLRFSLLGVSVPLWQPILFALCFHTLTNCFSRNPFPFTSIQIPRGCVPPNFGIFGLHFLAFRSSDIHTVRPSDFWYSAGNFPAGPARWRTVVYGVSAKAAVNQTPCGGIAMCNFCEVSFVLVYGCAETRSDERAG